ncbi:MAG: hypothetical protein AAGM38_00150 [Pseudomonadota bacterium]
MISQRPMRSGQAPRAALLILAAALALSPLAASAQGAEPDAVGAVLLVEVDPLETMGARLAAALAPEIEAALGAAGVGGGASFWAKDAVLFLSAPSEAVSAAQRQALAERRRASASRPEALVTLGDARLSRRDALTLALTPKAEAAWRLESAVLEDLEAALAARLAKRGGRGARIEPLAGRLFSLRYEAGALDPAALLRQGRIALHFEQSGAAAPSDETALSAYSDWIEPSFAAEFGPPLAQRLRLEAAPALSAPGVRAAQASFELATDEAVVDVALDAETARRLGEITSIGAGRLLALLIDGEVALAPYVTAPILNGRLRFHGGMSLAQAEALAALLEGPPLPAPVVLLEQR